MMSRSPNRFEEPRGLLGRLAARLMARMGRPFTALATEKLELSPSDQVLEIGFAHGDLSARIARVTREGAVAGVDPSADMVAFAAKRHRALVRSGRLSFREGTVSKIPFEDAHFDRAVGLNTVYFWPDVPSDLAEIRRVMKPGGRLLIGFRVARPKDSNEPYVARNGGASRPSKRTIEQLRSECEQAGFVDATAVTKAFGRSLLGRYEAGMVIADVPGEAS
jgi:arsenite methyltransferase